MKKLTLRALVVAATCAVTTASAAAQNFPTDDAVLRAIWEEGTRNSQIERLAQVLLDSIGPRLTGSPGQEAAQEWAVRTYQGWGSRLQTSATEPGGSGGVAFITCTSSRPACARWTAGCSPGARRRAAGSRRPR
jgi:carboxypeptidase Q